MCLCSNYSLPLRRREAPKVTKVVKIFYLRLHRQVGWMYDSSSHGEWRQPTRFVPFLCTNLCTIFIANPRILSRLRHRMCTISSRHQVLHHYSCASRPKWRWLANSQYTAGAWLFSCMLEVDRTRHRTIPKLPSSSWFSLCDRICL